MSTGFLSYGYAIYDVTTGKPFNNPIGLLSRVHAIQIPDGLLIRIYIYIYVHTHICIYYKINRYVYIYVYVYVEYIYIYICIYYDIVLFFLEKHAPFSSPLSRLYFWLRGQVHPNTKTGLSRNKIFHSMPI